MSDDDHLELLIETKKCLIPQESDTHNYVPIYVCVKFDMPWLRHKKKLK